MAYKKSSTSCRLPLLGILFTFCAIAANAQTLPVGDFREEQVRIQQLFNDSLSHSFSNRPIWKETYDTYFKGHSTNDSWWNRPYDFLGQKFLNDNVTLGIYEPVLTNTYNSKIPFGENNGAAWYGKGLNTEFQGGVFATSEYVTVTFRPHFIYTQNNDFLVPRFVPRDAEGNVQFGDETLGFGIDRPFRFGPDSYTTLDLGQSSARIHYKGIEAGISNEPLWWGPGVRYALTLSNNGPGLKHTFLGTRFPLKIPLNIGKFEFKLIGAWPDDSEYYVNAEQTDQRRFMSGLNLIFSPAFAPNLHLGFTRAVHQYISDEGLSISDFKNAINFSNRQTAAGQNAQNELISVYFRWVFPESHAEVYGEYYREDSFLDSRDLFLEPDHDRAYTIGFQKIIESNWIDFFKVNLELNSLVPNRLDEVRPQAYYYTHGIIEQGHTNGGQILGAAIGPGSESQFLGVDGYFSKGKVGLFVQRVVDNNFFHFEFNQRFIFPTSIGSKDAFNHRANLNIGANGSYKIGPLLLTGKLIWNKAFNYGRFDLGERERSTLNLGKDDLVNMNFSLSAQYLF